MGKENIFKCLVVFQNMLWKIFSSVWLYSWKYYRKHIFYLLLIFSQLPNKYIISFLSPQTQKKQNPKKKKNHQIWSNWEKKEEREAIGFNLEARSRGRGKIARRRRDRAVLESIFAWLARCCDRRSVGRRTEAQSVVVGLELSLFLLTVSFSLSLCASEARSGNGWSENRNVKQFSGQRLLFTVNWNANLENSIFHVQPNTRFYGKWFPKIVWSQKKRSLNV